MSMPLVEEAVVRMSVNGITTHAWRCTPTDLEALAIGRLYIDGVIIRADQCHLIVNPPAGAEIHIEARTSETGVVRAAAPRTLGIPEPETFAELFRTLFSTVDARHEHGGMHAAAVTDGQHIVTQVEDVGRHNVIDKIAGVLLLQNVACEGFGLLTSARVSGEIADKAARAGFAWLASRSIPTTLAVSFARAAHLPIIGRAAGKNAFVYQ